MGNSVASSISIKFNLSWGNAYAVRQAFLKGLDNKTIFFPLTDSNLNYTPHDGDEKLIEITKKIIKRQIGTAYKHVFLVNGATGGVTIAMRAFAQKGHRDLVTRDPPYFPLYPSMIQSAGLRHTLMCEPRDWDNPVILWDSPSNPQGFMDDSFHTGTRPMIHDAVYHSKVYTNGNHKALPCDVLVGSYSKLLGLNGIRTGWIATNDDLLALRIKELVTAEYCGLSSASNHILLTILRDYKSKTFWENFERSARNNLDANREEWTKLIKYFGDKEVSANGMFFYAPADAACQRLLVKSGIAWTPGSSLGTSDDFVRINLGQDCKVIRDAVKEVLKNDKR